MNKKKGNGTKTVIVKDKADKVMATIKKAGNSSKTGNGSKAKKTLKAVKTQKDKAAAGTKPVQSTVTKEVGNNLEALKKPVLESLELMKQAEAEAKELQDKAKDIIMSAKDAYLKDLIPYREACRKAGVPCEFNGGRSANVAERVSFLVEKTDKGVRVEIKGRPETKEVIPMDVLKASVSKAAYAYTDKHLGPREEIGNKGGGLGNRLRKMISK